jgi:valyl-tRNA synthetase
MVAAWPEATAFERDAAACGDFERMREAVSAVRNVRAQMRVPPGASIPVLVRTEDPELERALVATREMSCALARISELTVGPRATKPPHSASAVVKGGTVFVPLEGIIDLDVERGRLAKENERLESLVSGTRKRLADENFVRRAKPEIVDRERAKLESLENDLSKVVAALRDLD